MTTPLPPDDTCPIPAYFDSFAPPAPATEKLDGDQQADVVIVGGGYTGLSTAVHLAERGIRSLALEARDIGWGESSRSFGQVVQYLKHPPSHLARQLGPEVADRLVEATGRGPDLVFSLIEKYLNPHLHELAPGLWAALGYSGRGIAMATMMGRDLAARIAGASDTALTFSLVPLQPSRIRRIAKPLVGCLLNYYRVRDALDDMRHA